MWIDTIEAARDERRAQILEGDESRSKGDEVEDEEIDLVGERERHREQKKDAWRQRPPTCAVPVRVESVSVSLRQDGVKMDAITARPFSLPSSTLLSIHPTF